MTLEVIYIYCRKQKSLPAMEQAPGEEQVAQNLANAGLL